MQNFDDSEWEKINVPSSWENQGFHGYDGYAWYRTSFKLKTSDAEKDLHLDLVTLTMSIKLLSMEI